MKKKLTAMVLALGSAFGAWAGMVNLSALTADYVAKDGDTLTGKLGGDYKLSVADGATVTLNGVTIAVRADDAPYAPPQWPGINCEGSATIVLADDGSKVNQITGGNRWPGIYVPESKTLVIGGTGTLVVTGGVYGAGIGGADVADPDSSTGLRNCGNIVIEGGSVTAQGGDYAAGIGSGYLGHSGDVMISGGKVIATGGCSAPGIGGAYAQPEYSKCGDITISGGIVIATCGETTEMTGGAAGIGGGSAGGCGKITIAGGSVTATGYIDSAGIGGGHYVYAGCGDIVISGGSVTATGGAKGAGIGSGYNGNCGAITIENTVTKVVATKGEEAIDSIGQGWKSSTCGEVTVGDELEDTTHGNTRTIFGEEPVVKFEAAAVSSSESKTVKLTVFGGSFTGPSSVKVFMTYQTAAAADLDFANATINGVKVKGGLKFPLTLAWDTADVTPYVIEIPLKGDKQVEDDETLTFQLADVVGTEMGETDVCTVTVEDPAFDELRGRIETGTATKAESNSWIKVSHDGIPYMRGLAYLADGGKVTGSGYCPEGKKVTLKATANKGFAFLGWTTNSIATGSIPELSAISFVATTATLVIDRTAKPAANSKTSTTLTDVTEDTAFYAVFEGDPRVTATPVAFDEGKGLFVASDGGKATGAGRYAPGKKVTLKATANKGFAFGGWYDVNGKLKVEDGKLAEGEKSDEPISLAASLTFEMGEKDIDLYARFVTVEADKGSIKAGLNGGGLPKPADGEPVSLATNVTAGVYLEWSIAADALSQTTVKVAGLPSGLKFTAKDIVDSKTKQVTVPANTIYGAPTAASKTDKNGIKPSDVKITVTTAGKSSITYLVKLTVDPLPAWVVGTFDGEVEGGGIVQAFTIATSGKISGKILEGGKTWTLSAANFSRVEESDVFYATVIGKAGKEIVTNEVTVAALDGVGVASGWTASEPSLSWTAWQNLWKRADTKASQPVFKKNIVVEYYPLGVSGDKNNTVKFTFKKDGAVGFAGKIGGVAVSGSSQLVMVGRDDPIAPSYQVTLYAPPKPTAKPPFEGWCETLPVRMEVDSQNVVTAVELGDEPEMVQLWEGGPYWATKNIGAEKPEESGYYFWWGDALGYKWENEQWVASDGSASGFSFKYDNAQIRTYGKNVDTLRSEGWITAEGVLAPEHDAAQAHWGGSWRMPTDQELQDLVDNCEWTQTTVNGVNGYKVRGKGEYASASIFLPAAGNGEGITRYDAGRCGDYWSSVPHPDYSAHANVLYFIFESGHLIIDFFNRTDGQVVRPVQDAE